MDFKNIKGKIVFSWGNEAWEKANKTASSCNNFKLDAEYELVADEKISCYNCRYRKWTADSFICFKL
ncbi:MAG: hypothetical protein PWR10_2094 [Halanaerobiales bacterium]|nr:hypothetical protein [Halanaerobiales bacterium]